MKQLSLNTNICQDSTNNTIWSFMPFGDRLFNT